MKVVETSLGYRDLFVRDKGQIIVNADNYKT